MLKSIPSFAQRLVLRLVLVLVSTCAIVCLAPGFDSDERQLDVRLDAATVAKIRQSRSESRRPIAVALHFIGRMVRGDFGYSQTFNRPIAELLPERVAVTFRMAGGGMILGWVLAVSLASSVSILRSRFLHEVSGGLAACLLCAPSILLGFGFVSFQAPMAAAMACVVFPRVYLNLNTFFSDTASQPHVISAEAMGMSRLSLFRYQILIVNLPQVVTLAASSLSTTLGALVPIEVIGDVAGIGQLAWKGASGRDLPLLLSVTLLIALVNVTASLGTDMFVRGFREARA